MIEELSPDFLRTRLSSKWSSFGADVLPSNPAEMDFGVAPGIQRRMQELVDKQQYGYAPRGAANPVALVVDGFVRRMRDRFGFAADPARVVVLNDLVQAVMSTVMAFAEPHEGVALQVPAYPAFLSLLAQSGRPIVLNPMREQAGRYAIDVEGLEAALAPDTRVLLLCHPHNPTGRAFTREELAPLAALAIERDMVVVCDEIHADLMLDGRRHMPFGAMFPEAADR
ncbi:MAG TPA: aminotransferase class I/II-fold pyridoxal phosphate-dependent enzyme, partial [Devosia sp.]|nr:aminotransferase class I/II-fold pyridoxal phosphate-dependent enzyme [Devosia sp.]